MRPALDDAHQWYQTLVAVVPDFCMVLATAARKFCKNSDLSLNAARAALSAPAAEALSTHNAVHSPCSSAMSQER
jgi:hypothetical protein